MSGPADLRLVPPAAAPPPATPRPAARGRCDCGVLPHRCWCPAKPAADRAYHAAVETAARMLGMPR
jgi:hypothetical protein